jgi:hypothetical protein
MTFGDRNEIDDEVLAALRADAQAGVPQGSRERVLRRLGAGVGLLGATTTVTTGAGALVASAITTHSTAVLVSTLAIGIGIGFFAHSGLDAVRPQQAPVATVLVAPQAPATAPAAPRVPERAPEPAPTARPVSVPATSVRDESAPKRAPAGRVQPVGSPAAALVPAPVLAPPGLAAQQSLLDDARGAIRRGDGTSALSAIGAHRLRFPDTVLGEERAALEIRALLTLARTQEARERHAAFERAFPGSLFASSLRKLVPSGASNAESVTDASVEHQLKD